jgi:hypothetical protein
MPWLVEKIVETRLVPSGDNGENFTVVPIPDYRHSRNPL